MHAPVTYLYFVPKRFSAPAQPPNGRTLASAIVAAAMLALPAGASANDVGAPTAATIAEPTEEEIAEPTEQLDDEQPAQMNKYVIGATATIQESQSEFLFRARVDTGAKSCSLHVYKTRIENESESERDNIGKAISFEVENDRGETYWIKSKIVNTVIIKTTASRRRRYKVPLKLRWKDFEKEVVVTLNDRSDMEYPLLIGRNFLRGDFLVDVDVNNDDKEDVVDEEE